MNRPTLTVRGVTIGGAPLVIVPVVARALEALRADTESAVAAGADIVEWRADRLARCEEPALLLEAARVARDAADATPLLLTIRTDAEGGDASFTAGRYAELVAAAAASGLVDLIDVQYRHDAAAVSVAAAHAHGVPVVASNHDFVGTPPLDDLLDRLAQMDELGADVCKLAVMPSSRADVATLLLATARRAEASRTPLLTISMGELGVVSRLAGFAFGSAATFATVGEASAPGQPTIAEVRAALAALGQVG